MWIELKFHESSRAGFILSAIVSIIMVLFTILAYAMIMYLGEEWASNNMNRI